EPRGARARDPRRDPALRGRPAAAARDHGRGASVSAAPPRSRRATRGGARVLLALAGGAALLPHAGVAQLPERPSASAAPAPAGAAAGVHVTERPGGTLVAAALVIPAGSASDPASAPGTARLLGETIAQAVRWRIDP